jgi:Transposase family tnp2
MLIWEQRRRVLPFLLEDAFTLIYPFLLEDACSHWMKETKKTVYLGYRRFLRRQHPYRKKRIEFNGKVENGNAPMELTGLEIYDKVKNI